MREKPGIFEGGDKAKRLKDDASAYETYTLDMGLSGPQAVARIDETRTPEFQKRREALKKDAEAVVKDTSVSDLTSDYAGWFTSAPELGGSLAQCGVILDSYREMVKEHFIRTGDAEVAKAMAKKDVLRDYNVSNVTGKRRLMRFPPESRYPAIEPPGGGEPDHSYFTRQLQETVKERAGVDVPVDDIYIEAVPQTAMDIRAGRPPRYGVVWKVDRDGIGVYESAPGMVFFADVKGEQERATLGREERLKADRQREIERQQAKENDPARRAAKAIVRGVKERLLNPEAITGEDPTLSVSP
jgi:hypothetical protein